MIKKFVPYILIAVILVQLFAPFTVGMGAKNNLVVGANKAEAVDCVLNPADVTFPNGWDLGEPPHDASVPRTETITMNVSKTSGCKDKNLYIIVSSVKDNNALNKELETSKYLINTDGLFSFTFKTGEKTCTGGSCDHVWIKIIITDPAQNKTLQGVNVGPLAYLCLGTEGGYAKCNTGNSDFSWGISGTPTLPLASDATNYKGKYFYTSTITDKTSSIVETKKSETFDTMLLCEANRKENTVSTNLFSVETTSCELFSENSDSKTTKTTTKYYYEWTMSDGTKTSSGDFDTEELCKIPRDEFDSHKPEGMVVSVCLPHQVTQIITGTQNKKDIQGDTGFPACSIWSPSTYGGCIGIGLYWLFFKPTSFVFGLAGKILDFTIMYSISDTSYRSAFVVEGWGLIRDFCNVFFIFVLLYIAFGTILNLNSVKTKEMIINVVIIGLLINFSLFATQVIIDASNVLTRVFYNQKTIVTGTKDPVTGITTSELGDFGEIKLSEAIVSKVDPQQLVIQAQKVSAIPETNKGVNEGEKPAGISAGSFIIVVILATAVNVVGTIAFLSSALIFIGRVVMLWLAMILAPLAFFSYMVPSLRDIKMIGWKKWWPDTLNMAFVAPIFAFFMYIIVGFMDKGLGILDKTTGSVANLSTGLSFVVAITVPFIFIMILLMKAKNIAVSMSGEVGAAMSKAGAAVGGLALGAATGGAALAMRGTVGRLGSKIANSDRVKGWEKKGIIGAAALRNIGTAAGKSSFDARNTEAGKAAGKGLGVDLGKVKEGGYTKARTDKVAYRQNRVKELEAGEDSKLTQDIRAKEQELNKVKMDRNRQDALVKLNNGEIDKVKGDAIKDEMLKDPRNQGKIDAYVESLGLGGLERAVATGDRAVVEAERTLKDATNALLAAKTTKDKATAQTAVDLAKKNRDAEIKGGEIKDETGKVVRFVSIGRDKAKDNLEARQGKIREQEGPIHTAENELKLAENARNAANRETRIEYAKTIQGGWSNTINTIVTLGEHSVHGETEAANKILAGIQEDKK